MKLCERRGSLDDRAFGPRPTTEPLGGLHRRLWGIVLALLIAGALMALLSVPYVPGLLVAIAIGVAVAAVVTARRARNQ